VSSPAASSAGFVPLDQLGLIAAARAALDDHELALIDRARHAGATWGQVAAALGLTSRQAAEQRRQRLSAAASRVARSDDARYGHRMVQLRAAIDALHRQITADAAWETRFVRAPLVRATVAAAVDAPPGSLFALAAQAAADLAASDADRPPAALRDAVQTLYRAVRSAVNDSLT
jgi:hypothetical protein